jgi:hypothetical protein
MIRSFTHPFKENIFRHSFGFTISLDPFFFCQEIQIHSSLKHKHIIELLDFYEDGDDLCVVTEIAQAELHTLAKEDGVKLPEAQE